MTSLFVVKAIVFTLLTNMHQQVVHINHIIITLPALDIFFCKVVEQCCPTISLLSTNCLICTKIGGAYQPN